MLLKKIKIKNIRSYENAEILLPKGSVLLSGDIGAGKTTLLLAIEFALFGLQPGQKGISLLKNSTNEGEVEVEFEVDGQEVLVRRVLKRGKKGVSQESSFISVNGKTEEKTSTEMKNAILNLLNYPAEFAKKTNLLYRFSVYTPQEQMKQIIIENPETRLNTIRHVFGIDKYKRIKENSAILASRLRESIRMKQGQISDLENLKLRKKEREANLKEIKKQIPEIDLRIKEVKKLREEKEKEVEGFREKIKEKQKMENEIEKSKILLMTKEEQVEKNKKEIKVLNERVETALKSFNESEFDEIVGKIGEKRKEYESLNKEIINLAAEINTLNSRKGDLEEKRHNMVNLRSCPTCLQEVSDAYKQTILTKIDKEIYDINNYKIEFDNNKQKKEISISRLNKEISELEERKGALQEMKIRLEGVEDNKKRVSELEGFNKELEKDIGMFYEQIKMLRESVSGLKKYENIAANKEEEISKIGGEERGFEIKKAEIAKEIELGNSEIKRLVEDIKEKEKVKGEMLYVSELESWISKKFLDLIAAIERNVMLKLRSEFSKLFNEWFGILVGDNFVVRLDDDFTPVIEQGGYELDYSYLSGGERTAVALAYRLALNQTINSMMSEIKTKGIVILDEPTDGFSQQQLDKMRDVLKELNSEQLIIVSHDQKVEGFVENIIRLKKELGVSRVV